MARKKRKTKAKPRRAPAKSKRKVTKSRAKKKARSGPKKRASKGSGKGSEVEKRWSAYWRCRKELEDACEAVRDAQADLTQAMTRERASRSEFEKTKAALTDLLEVEELSRELPVAPKVIDIERDIS